MELKEIPIEEFDHMSFETPDGVFIKFIHLKTTGWVAGKHVHDYDHTTMLAKGSVMAFVEGEEPQKYTAPSALLVKRGKSHAFMALEDDTRLFCIHNTLNPKFKELD